MKTKYLLTLLFLSWGTSMFSAENKLVRRHFVIAYNMSDSFKMMLNKDLSINECLVELFEQGRIQKAYEKNDKELIADSCFFDPLHDEISFYPFGITANELQDYQNRHFLPGHPEAAIGFLNRHLVKKRLGSWSEYKHQETPESFLRRMVGKALEPTDFGKGITLSYLVHPFIVNSLDTTQVAEDYILIVLSDFATGADQANLNEFALVENVFGKENWRGVIDYVDHLNTYFKQVTFFYYIWQKDNRRTVPVRLAAYHIKPSFPLEFPVVSPVILTQHSLNGERYAVSEVTLRWESAKPASIQSIDLQIRGLNKREQWRPLFSSLIAEPDENGVLHSQYASNNEAVRDSLGMFQQIPALSNIPLKGLRGPWGYKKLDVEYSFIVRYEEPGIPHVGYISRSLPSFLLFDDNSILFRSLQSKDYLIGILLLVLALAGVLWLRIRRGRIIGVKLIPNQLGSDFVRVMNCRRTRVEYYPLNDKAGKYTREIEFETIPLGTGLGIRKWSADVVIRLDQVQVYCMERIDSPSQYPGEDKFQKKEIQGFSVLLYAEDGSSKKRQEKGELSIRCSASKKKFRFKVQVDEPPSLPDRNKVYDIHYKLKVQIRNAGWKIGPARGIDQDLDEYDMAIGPVLQGNWIGLDPGATATCLALSNAEEEIVLCDFKKEKENRAYPFRESLLLFPPSKAKDKNFDHWRPHIDYQEGPEAFARWHLNGAGTRFQSIKKLLSDPGLSHKISRNGKSRPSLTGLELAQLLLRGVYQDFKDSLVYKELAKKKRIPSRAIVAVPNTFTMIGVQAMVDSVQALGCFEEVDYIDEATAVVCYYLSQPAYPKSYKEEQILVFDMGGSSLNASVFRIEKVDRLGQTCVKYRLHTLGKVGYAIGGDTIDYCLLKRFIEIGKKYALNTLPDIRVYMKDKKYVLLKDIAAFKKAAMMRGKNKMAFSEVTSLLKQLFPKGLKKVERENPDWAYMQGLIQEQAIDDPLFNKFIYENISNSIRELMNLPAVAGKVDKILFSGRSSIFPGVREKVEKTMEDICLNNKPDDCFLPETINFETVEELKAAVAMGACWYGQKAGDVLEWVDEKNFYWIGVKRVVDKIANKVEFDLLISPDDVFEDGKIEKEHSYETEQEFLGDDNKVKFYQLMGVDYKEVFPQAQSEPTSRPGKANSDAWSTIFLEEKYAYKRVEIAQLDLNQPHRTVKGVKVELDTKGNIQCFVRFPYSSQWEKVGVSRCANREIVATGADPDCFFACD